MNPQELLFLIAAFQSLVIAAGWYFVNKSLHHDQTMTSQQTLSNLYFAFAFFAMAARGESPGAGAIILGDLFQLLGVAALVHSIHAFWNIFYPRGWVRVIMLAALAASVWFAVVHPLPEVQAVAAQVGCSALIAIVTWRMWRPMRTEFGFWTASLLPTLGLALVAVMLSRLSGHAEFGVSSFKIGVLATLVGLRVLPSIVLGALAAARALKRAERVARADGLTGALSYTSFVREASRLWHERKRDRVLGATVYCDVDQFKQINVDHGRRAGDQLLQQIAQRIQSQCGEDVVFGRISGDRFALVQGPATVASATRLAHRLLQTVASGAWKIDDASTSSAKLSLSIGVAFDKATDGAASDALQRAQQAAAAAAQQGGGRVIIA